MLCDNCKNKFASRLSYRENGKCSCEKCGRVPAFKFSDVYFKEPYFDQHISDPDKSPLGNFIATREQKAQLMKKFGLGERGDKYHGSR